MEDIIFKNFEEAGQTVLKFLSQKFGFDLWMITRTEGDNWIVLQSEDKGFKCYAGTSFLMGGFILLSYGFRKSS